MSHPKDSLFLRFAGGGLAIFAGVAMALAADDWRLGLEEREEAEESLALVVADLRIDSASFGSYAGTLGSHAAAAAWLMENWPRPAAPVDSIETQVYRFFVGGLLLFSRPAYDGLADSNRLRLIEDKAVRDGIRDYYERTQATLMEFWKFSIERGTRNIDNLAPHFQQPQGERPGELWPYAQERVTMRHDWSQVTADPLLEETMHQYGVLAQFMALELIQARDEATELLRLIEASRPKGRSSE